MLIKKIIAAVSAAMICFSFGINNSVLAQEPVSKLEQIKKSGKLSVYTNPEFPPYEFVEGKEIVGVDIEIAKRIADKIGVKLEVVSADFGGIVASIASGKGDLALSGITITDERREQVDFSNPYVDSVQYIIVPDGSPIQFFEDLEGKAVGAQLGTTGAMFVDDEINLDEGVLKDKGSELKTYNSAPSAMQDLIAGRISAVVIDEQVAISIANESPGYQALPFKYKSGDPVTEQFGACIAKGNEDFLAVINEVIDELTANDEVNKFIGAFESTERGNTFADQFNATFVENSRYLIFLEGFARTLTIALCSVVIGIALGILAAVIKVFNHRTGKLKPLRILVDIYLQVFRGTPIVVQLLIWYYIILVNVHSGVVVAVIGFGINSGAYVAEIIRAGIMSIDKGQSEAGRSLGLSEMQTMRYIVLPQAIKNTLPALFNEFISLLKETSVAGFITVIDLTKAGDLVRSRTMLAFFPLLSVALIYFILVVGLTQLQANLERRLRKSER